VVYFLNSFVIFFLSLAFSSWLWSLHVWFCCYLSCLELDGFPKYVGFQYISHLKKKYYSHFFTASPHKFLSSHCTCIRLLGIVSHLMRTLILSPYFCLNIFITVSSSSPEFFCTAYILFNLCKEDYMGNSRDLSLGDSLSNNRLTHKFKQLQTAIFVFFKKRVIIMLILNSGIVPFNLFYYILRNYKYLYTWYKIQSHKKEILKIFFPYFCSF
jgi:hypothetical protein